MQEESPIHLSGPDAIQKIQQLLKLFRSCMMLTQDSRGTVHTRPMALQGEISEFVGTLWFFTGLSTEKAKEIAQDSAVSLIFQSDSDNTFLHLFGEASIEYDKAKIKELYTPIIKTWFPKGVDDPDLTLIRFDAEHGHFWDSPGGMLRVFAAFTKSVVTGKPGKGGESAKVQLTRSESIQN